MPFPVTSRALALLLEGPITPGTLSSWHDDAQTLHTIPSHSWQAPGVFKLLLKVLFCSQPSCVLPGLWSISMFCCCIHAPGHAASLFICLSLLSAVITSSPRHRMTIHAYLT